MLSFIKWLALCKLAHGKICCLTTTPKTDCRAPDSMTLIQIRTCKQCITTFPMSYLVSRLSVCFLYVSVTVEDQARLTVYISVR